MNASSFLRAREWQITLAALGVGLLLLAFGSGSPAAAGEPLTVSVTVVPSDARNLACASGAVVDGVRCAFDEAERPVSARAPLRPYVTVGRELVLLSGVFEQEAVGAWARRHRRGEPRVTLECTGTHLGRVPEARVRFHPTASWDVRREIPAARVESCRIRSR